MKTLIQFILIFLVTLNFTQAQETFVNSGNFNVIGGNIGFFGNVVNNGNFTSSAGTVALAGNNPKTLGGSSPLVVNNLNIVGSGAITSIGDLSIRGTLALNNANLNLSDKILVMENNSSWSGNEGKINATNGKIIFKGANFATSVLSTPNIKDLTFDRSSTLEVDGDLTITGELELANGIVDVNNNTLKINGSVANGNGSLDLDNATIDFNNSGNISLPQSFISGDVKEMKVTGGGGVSLGSTTKISNTLTLANGVISSSTANILELGTNINTTADVVWNNTSNARVIGPVKRWYGTSANSSATKGVIPVGETDFNRSVQINFNQSSNGGYIIAEYIEGLPDNQYELPLSYNYQDGSTRYIQNADQTGYWSITPYSSSGVAYASMDDVPYQIRLRINQPNAVANGNNLPDPPSMRIIRAKGNPLSQTHEEWEIGNAVANISSVTEPNTNNFDYIVEATMTGFSWFNIGGDNSTPLPIELYSFDAWLENRIAFLQWKTASEKDNHYFTVEKSSDGVNFSFFQQVMGAGNSNELLTYNLTDENPFYGVTYYRLSQTDFDGTTQVLPTRMVMSEISTVFIYPNPSTDGHFQVISAQPFTYNICDAFGKVIQMGESQSQLNLHLASGVYFINLTINGKLETRKVVIQ